MASSSNNRGDGSPNSFTFSGRSSNVRAFEHIHDEDENVDFAGDDGDDDDEDLNGYGAPPSYAAGYGEPYYPGVNLCIVCQERPPYSRNGKSYPTCGMRCKGILERLNNSSQPPLSPGGRHAGPSTPTRTPTRPGATPVRVVGASTVDDISHSFSTLSLPERTPPRQPVIRRANTSPCVVCTVKPCYDGRFVTCGITCAEKLCKTGSANPTMCNYCHRQPKIPGSNQCGPACVEKARVACLLCKSRPKYQRYHLCGKSCKAMAAKWTPLILEAPAGHATYAFVEKKFRDAWKFPTTPIPPIKNIFKIIESSTFLQPYDRYKKNVGNEVFRYHGTTRKCTLGSGGNTQLCTNTTCALCCILKTSFKTSLANPGGAFGPGIYSSSASNKAYSYSAQGTGAMLLTKVILGNIRTVQGWNEVMSCPAGFNSVVFDRQNGSLNETIVYSDDAIRPVFLITF